MLSRFNVLPRPLKTPSNMHHFHELDQWLQDRARDADLWLKYPLLQDKQRYQNLPQRLSDLIQQIRNKDVHEGAQRLELIGEQFGHVPFESSYQLIDPDAINQEIETAEHRQLIHLLHLLQGVFSLLPLILTWVSLFMAASAYQQYVDMVSRIRPVTASFLQLWQSGFALPPLKGLHPQPILVLGIRPLTFSEVAITDACLLFVLLCIPPLIRLLEDQARKKSADLSKEVVDVTRMLIEVVGLAGPSSLLSPKDINLLGEIVKNGVEAAVNTAMQESKRVATEAQQFIDQSVQRMGLITSTFNESLTRFNQSFLAFHSMVSDLKSETQKLAGDLKQHNEHITTLIDANTLLNNTSRSLAEKSDAIALHVEKHANINLGIEQHIKNLDAHEREHTSAVTTSHNALMQLIGDNQQDLLSQVGTLAGKIEISQKEVSREVIAAQKDTVAKVTNAQQEVLRLNNQTQKELLERVERAVDKVNEVAREVHQLGQHLGNLTEDQVRDVASLVREAADHVKTVAKGLTEIEHHLQNTSQGLHDATDGLKTASQGLHIETVNMAAMMTLLVDTKQKDYKKARTLLEKAVAIPVPADPPPANNAPKGGAAKLLSSLKAQVIPSQDLQSQPDVELQADMQDNKADLEKAQETKDISQEPPIE